jgi:hypothetical protein
MKKVLLSLLIVLIVLSACEAFPPGEYDISPKNYRTVIPTASVAVQYDGDTYGFNVRNKNAPQTAITATLYIPTATNTPTASKTSTSAPTPTFTRTPTITPTNSPPTGSEESCVLVLSTNVNERVDANTSSEFIRLLLSGDIVRAYEFKVFSGIVWARIWDDQYDWGWFGIKTYSGTDLNSGVWWTMRYDTIISQCDLVPTWPSTLVLPPLRNTAGAHTLGFSVNNFEMLTYIDRFNFLKLTDDSYFLATEFKKKVPNGITVHRSIHVIDYGLRNCPPGYGVDNPVTVAIVWWDVIYETWGARNLLGPNSPIDYFEVINECGWVRGDWENAFWGKILDLAKSNGNLCIALYSDSYGTPEPEQYFERRPILSRVRNTTCRNNKHHVVSLHTYGNFDAPDAFYIAYRWRMLLNAVGPEYLVDYIFTEQGVTNAQGNNDGRGSPNCSLTSSETVRAVLEFRKYPEVLGFALYSFGGSTEWLDLTQCLPQIHSALEPYLRTRQIF